MRMRHFFRGGQRCLPLFMLCFMAGGVAAGPPPARAVVEATSKPGDSVAPQSLRDDPRLQKIVSVSGRRRIGSIMTRITRVCKVPLTTDEKDIETGEIMIEAKGVPAWQVMDAIAGLATNRWVYVEKNRGYLLMGSRHEYDILLPKNEHERLRNHLGLEMADRIRRELPAEQQELVSSKAGILLKNLSPDLQDLAHRMLWAQIANRLQEGQLQQYLPFREGEPLAPPTVFQFQLEEDKSGYRQYKVSIDGMGIGGMGFSVNDYQERVRKRDEIALSRRRSPGAGAGATTPAPFFYDPAEDVCSPKELGDVKALRHPVRLTPTRLTYQQAVRALARQADVPCATLCERVIEPNPSLPMRVEIKPMPLREALDYLTETFYGIGEWEWRKSGTLVARQPRLMNHFSTLQTAKPAVPSPAKPDPMTIPPE